MIARMKGLIINKKPPFILLEVCHICYEIETSMTTFNKLPASYQQATLYTDLLMREERQKLFGFIDELERDIFRELIKTSGIGPKIALAILSNMPPYEFILCIKFKKIKELAKIPGISTRKGEKLCLDLENRISKWQRKQIDQPNETTATKITTEQQILDDASEALLALGYKQKNIDRVMMKFANDHISCEQLIRLCLKEL